MLFDDAIKIGKVTKYNSCKGGVVVRLTDTAILEDTGNCLIIEANRLKVPFLMESYAIKSRDTALVHLLEVRNEDEAREIIGSDVFCQREAFADAEISKIPTLNYLTGFEVHDKKAGLLGTVTATDDSSLNLLLYIKGEKDLVIPFNEDFLVSLNPNKRVLKLDLPEGITDIN